MPIERPAKMSMNLLMLSHDVLTELLAARFSN